MLIRAFDKVHSIFAFKPFECNGVRYNTIDEGIKAYMTRFGVIDKRSPFYNGVLRNALRELIPAKYNDDAMYSSLVAILPENKKLQYRRIPYYGRLLTKFAVDRSLDQ